MAHCSQCNCSCNCNFCWWQPQKPRTLAINYFRKSLVITINLCNPLSQTFSAHTSFSTHNCSIFHDIQIFAFRHCQGQWWIVGWRISSAIKANVCTGLSTVWHRGVFPANQSHFPFPRPAIPNHFQFWRRHIDLINLRVALATIWLTTKFGPLSQLLDLSWLVEFFLYFFWYSIEASDGKEICTHDCHWGSLGNWMGLKPLERPKTMEKKSFDGQKPLSWLLRSKFAQLSRSLQWNLASSKMLDTFF